MKTTVLLAVVALFLASCAATPVSDEQAKRNELQQYKQQMQELKQKIEVLENELSVNETKEMVKVNVSGVETRLFEHFVEANGTVEAEMDVDVSPESAGIIEAILVKEGDRVSKGQVLARLNGETLKRSLDEMNVQLGLARTTFERQKNLWEQHIGSEIQFLQAKANLESLEKRIDGMNAQIDMAVIKSPVDGVVDIIYQKKGQIGSPQVPFAKVLNIDKVKIYADVAETYLTKLKQGDMVTVSFPALERDVKVPIYRIGNTIDPNNRTFKVRVNLSNPDRMIKPNLVCVLKIRDYVSENTIVIPSLLIKEDFRGDYTYVVSEKEGKKVASKVYVKPGMSDNNMTEVTEGLTAGMQVISEGFNQVIDGTPILF